jgi:hypothetical protein
MSFSLNPLSLISNAAESICDAVLPKELEFVGDLVGGAVDVYTGNSAKYLDDLNDLAKDLPQQLGTLTSPSNADQSHPTDLSNKSSPASTSKSNSAPTSATASAEPDAPPSYGATSETSKTQSATILKTPDSGTSTQSTASKDQAANDFFKLSDLDLMNAVRDGKLPQSVKDDPAQMQRLQLRMTQISEMNQIMTSMISSLHEMNKQIIQNLRV